MTFYQELQLSSTGSKQLIKNTTDKKEKRRHILIYNFKVYLVMVFCVAVVSLYSKFIGNDNSVVGVTVLLAVLVLRQADFRNPYYTRTCLYRRYLRNPYGRSPSCQHGIPGSGILCQCGLYHAADDPRMPQCDHVQSLYFCPWLSIIIWI